VNPVIRPIPVAAARLLRQRVLRPHQPPDACVYPLDDRPETGHFGAFRDGELIGAASVFREAPGPESAPGAWRIRGMATDPGVRGAGHGRALLQRCLEHAAAAGGTEVWCNARTTAAGFYGRHGFRQVGPGFEVEWIGLHLRMHCQLPNDA